jgi:Cu(I)/Ag(I) efflux system membrane fusion protein
MSAIDDSGPPQAPRGAHAMAIVRWVLVALAAVVAVGSVLSYAGVRLGGGKRGEATGPAEQQLYQCPMHPSIVQDHPGECPICGMTLVPKPKGGAPAAAATPADAAAGVPGLTPVDLTAERIQLIGMRTAVVGREALGGELRTVGVIAANERGLAQINTRFAGWIQTLAVSATGERVRRGQVLATIYSPDVLRAQQELLVANGWTADGAARPHQGNSPHESLASELASSARRRLELLGISAQEIDEIARTGKPVEAIAIRSPVEGYVVAKTAMAGVAVQPGAVLFEVADLSTVWVNAEIYEQEIARVHVGQKARLELSSFPGETHAGKVQFIYPVLDTTSRTLKVRLEFKNRSDRNGPRLRPGMYGTVLLALPPTTGLMVPAEAVVDTGEARYLFISKEGGRFEPRAVKVGARVRDQVEILSGVTEGETVVATGNFLIDSESRLRAAIEGRPGGGAPAPASACDAQFDAQKFPDKNRACRACEVQHRGMGTMVDDCKNAIPKPWR